MFSSTSSPRPFSSSGGFLSGASTHLRLGLIAPRITLALTPPDPHRPEFTETHCDAPWEGQSAGQVSVPAPPPAPCPSGSLQTGSPRTPKVSLTWGLSQAGPLEGLRPCWLRAGSPPAPWPIFSPGPLTASRRCGLGLGALSPGPSQHRRLSLLQPCCHCRGQLSLACVASVTTSSRNALRSLGSSRATLPRRFRP